jgi:hypothetical protein
VFRRDGVTYLGHGGSMPGFLAGVTVDPEEQTGSVVLANATSGLDGDLSLRMLETVREHEPRVVEAWHPLSSPDPDGLELIGTWYWGTTSYGLRLRSDGELELISLLGGGRPSRLRRREDGGWVGLTGYYAGEPLRPVRDGAGRVIALDLGSFLLTRTPYDPAAPVPGGTDPAGWQPGTA